LPKTQLLKKLLYNLLIRSYHAMIVTLSPINFKAKLWIEGRKDIFKRLKEAVGKSSQKIAWFHCASLGEFEQGRPLIERFRSEFPQYKILLTFFSPSGYEIRKNYNQADFIFYLPIDTASNAKRFVSIVKPSVVLFVKYEFWYHYISEIKKHKIPLISVSAIFRKEQLFFKSYGRFYADLLKSFDHIFVQNDESKQLLQQIDYRNASVTGDTRFDRVKQIASSAASIPVIEKFKEGKLLFVAGSTWPKDLAVLIPFINSLDKELKVIIAPHEIHAEEIDGFIKEIERPCLKFSAAEVETVGKAEVLFIDNIGMLSSLYRYCQYAYIGGGFGKGIHNILEAVVNGVPVLFGPNYGRFKEAVDLVKLETAFAITSKEELEKKFDFLNSNDDVLRKITLLNKQYVEQNSGATENIIDYCKKLLSNHLTNNHNF
jgi:3-deoxy-D-manno-octulosonic-acid transferase